MARTNHPRTHKLKDSSSTPTCQVCGTKFPGNPCKKCKAPAGLEKKDVPAFKRMTLHDQGLSKNQVKKQMKLRQGTKTQKRRKHGMPR